ncbi:uncharacterized protein LTR77_009894 [Saxophila tyrrhenica]|uniref:Uncharacterized protein n=1 Tax=Saxophila tyrrhenica TaxID=1690608 RepID=A0AAV9NWW5_9PEZI|nr:hypothetical protein LTR77_009894 [Saxophila tyrrhenica]
MAAIARRTAAVATRSTRTPVIRQIQPTRSYAAPADPSSAKQPDEQANADILRKGARRDPELYTLLAIMSGAFGLAGWHFSRNPTSSSSENKVSMAAGSEPWNTGGNAKYQYHPGGDQSRGRKDAPSALNEVIIPNVNLPKVSRKYEDTGSGKIMDHAAKSELHEKYNKWGKEGY